MSLVPKKQLDFWINNQLNVLFKGHAGVGKTHLILETFKRHNLKYQYYSCSTLDPYVDFIGVPREVDDGNGNKVLDLVRPKQWANDEIEVLFLDEFNRSKQAVRNAVMELIQFKSINGRKFNNLKMIWAAINPDNDEDANYDVETLDPAQQDRFHIHYEVPYEPDAEFFFATHGSATAKIAIEWWNSLDKSVKMLVSPRRLDYALQVCKLGGDIDFVLPKKSNPKSFKTKLESVSVVEQLEKFLEKDFTDTEAIKNFFANQKNYNYGIPYVLKNKKSWDKILPNLSSENLTSIVITKENEKIMNHMVQNSDSYIEYFKEVERLSNDVGIKNYIKKVITTTTTPNNLIDMFKIDKTKIVETEKTKLLCNWLETTTKLVKDSISTRHSYGGLKSSAVIETPKKISFINQYYEQALVEFRGNKRPDSLVNKESLFIKTIAERMQSSVFQKIFKDKESLIEFYAEPVRLIKTTTIYDSHFAKVFNGK